MGAKTAEVQYPENCIACGHCIAICPKDAITHGKLDEKDFPLRTDPQISLTQFTQLTRNRRSTREFKKELISRDILEQLVHSTHYAPTGENAQEIDYVIIDDAPQLQMIRDAMAKKFKMLYSLANFFLVKGIMYLGIGKKETTRLIESLKHMIERYNKGQDPFLRNAHVLIILVTKTKTAMRNLDAGIAGYHLNLAAETIGIGNCWIGFHSILAKYFPSVKKASRIPNGTYVLASIILGYPLLKYRKNIPRRIPSIG